jgi:hypothetical protein
MIPLSDASRRPVRFPIATVSIIVLNFLNFFIELGGGTRSFLILAYMAHNGVFILV